jgi:hypothetical protein
LDGYENAVAGCKSIQSQKIERRGAVDQNVGIEFLYSWDGITEAIFPVFDLNQLDSRADEVFVRGYKIQVLYLCMLNTTLDGLVENQGLVERSPCGIFRKTKACGSIGLGVAIYDEGFLAGSGDTGAQVYGCCCFSHSTLLISHGDGARQEFTPQYFFLESSRIGECLTSSFPLGCFTWNITRV